MIKVIQEAKKGTSQNYDSLVVEIPRDFAVSHGLPERSFATLTVQDGKIISDVIEYSDVDEEEVDQFLKEFPDLSEEMRSDGD